MVRTIQDLMNEANAILGENSSDDALGFIGNLSDTLNSFSNSEDRIKALEQEKTDIDNAWRKKYRERFFSPKHDDEDDPEPEDKPALKTKFEELFS